MPRFSILATLLATCLTSSIATAQPSLDDHLKIAQPGSFEAGALQTLKAVETLFQTRYKYEIGRSMGFLMGRRTNGFSSNPNPDQRDGQTFIAMLEKFEADLTEARRTLQQARKDPNIHFEWKVEEIWLDLDGNGQRSDVESMTQIAAQFLSGRGSWAVGQSENNQSTEIKIRFDHADAIWLIAYTHLLSGLANGVMAFDPSPVFESILERRANLEFAPKLEVEVDAQALKARLAGLEEELVKFNARKAKLDTALKPLQIKRSELIAKRKATNDEEEKAKIRKEQLALSQEERELRRTLGGGRQEKRWIDTEIRAVKRQLAAIDPEQNIEPARTEFMLQQARAQQETIDSIYALVTSLGQKPDAARIQAMRRHWSEMLTTNTEFWAAVTLESDDQNEWIPNANQTSGLGIEIDELTIKAWQSILQDAEAILKGDLLVPHWALPPEMGVNLALWFENPEPIDVLGWLHGVDAFKFAAFGPRISEANWTALQRLTQGRAGAFAVFFN